MREHTFEGIVPNLERRYKETDSMAVKEELSKYLNKPILSGVRRHAAAKAKLAIRSESGDKNPARNCRPDAAAS